MLHLHDFTCMHASCCDMLGTTGWTCHNRRRATFFRTPPLGQPSPAQSEEARIWLIIQVLVDFVHDQGV
jgi:hypothetical protein